MSSYGDRFYRLAFEVICLLEDGRLKAREAASMLANAVESEEILSELEEGFKQAKEEVEYV